MLRSDTQPVAGLSLLEMRESLPEDLHEIRVKLCKKRFASNIIEDAVGHVCIVASEVIDGQRNKHFPTHTDWMRWLYRIAFNEACKLFKRRRHHVQFEDHHVPAHHFERLEAQERYERLLEAIDALPALLRLLVEFCYLDGHTYAEAAKQFGLRANGVKHQLDKARDQLRPAIADSPYSV
jgi:RNA polymerase sigma factor (sigma-70 family)